MNVLFFPQRETLGLDSREVTPGLVSAIVFIGGEVHSSKRASVLLDRLGMKVSCRTVQRILADVGGELIERRDKQLEPRRTIESAPQLAVVQCDGPTFDVPPSRTKPPPPPKESWPAPPR